MGVPMLLPKTETKGSKPKNINYKNEEKKPVKKNKRLILT